MKIVEALSLKNRVNTLGIIGALLLIYISLSNQPWWTLAGGLGEEHSFSARISPFTFEAQILGKPLVLPIMPYLILAAKLTALLAAATMIIGSFLPTKPWAKPLMSMKALALPIMFVVGVFAGSQLVNSYIGVSIPVTGRFTINYSITYGELSILTQTPSMTTFTLEYWIALVAGVFTVLARILQGKMLV